MVEALMIKDWKNILGRAVRGRVRSVRIPFRLLVVFGAAAGITVGLAVYVLSNYLGIVLRQARDAYVVYRLTNERDELKATRERLEKEIASLRNQHDQASEFQVTMKRRLDELHAVVESSTALGLLHKDAPKDKGAPSQRAPQVEPTLPEGQSALAALLDSPVLQRRGSRARRSERIEQLRETNRGLGGAEIECRRDGHGKIVCTSTSGKENIALDDVRASFAPPLITADKDSWKGEQKDLLERLNQYTSLLKALPLGTPVLGEFTSGFGYRVSPFSHRSSLHEGVDISLDPGSRVRAPGNGVVVNVEYDGTYGWMVDIAHTPELVTRYAHLTKALVRKGQSVSRGQVVALSGSTGRSTGPHLHYEVRYRGRPKNPMSFIALAEKLARVM